LQFCARNDGRGDDVDAPWLLIFKVPVCVGSYTCLFVLNFLSSIGNYLICTYSVSAVVPSERQSLDPIELLLWIGPNYCMVGLLRARYRCSSGMLPIHSSIKLLYTYVVSTITVCTCSTYHNKGYICRRVVTVLLDLMLI